MFKPLCVCVYVRVAVTFSYGASAGACLQVNDTQNREHFYKS